MKKLSIQKLSKIVGGRKRSTYLQRCSNAGYYIGKATRNVIGIAGWLFKK